MKEEAGQEIPIWADEKDMPADGSTEKQRVMWGHDVRFCRKLNLHGHPVYVDGRVLCGHYDIRTGQTFVVPSDAPGFQKTLDRAKNINTPDYWDQVYSREGADSWRKYPQMFQAVVDKVHHGAGVVELGCGVGILGSKLTAEKSVIYSGYDISPIGVEMAKSRFLDAKVLDVRDFAATMVGEVVVMTEILEHLDRGTAIDLLRKLGESVASKIIFTTPNGCMGPEEVPEHTALFDMDYVEELLGEALGPDNPWRITMEPADDNHLICVMER